MTGVAFMMLPVILLAAALAIYLPVPTEAGARVAQHLLSLSVQILAAAAAAAALFQAARVYRPGDHERRVWHLTAAAALVWAIGLFVYALREWTGQVRAYPATADWFLVGAFLLLFAALADEFRLVNPMLTRRQRWALAATAAGLWFIVIGGFMWPMLANPQDLAEKVVDLFYASTVAVLVPLALGPALAFRGGASGYVWLGLAAGVACLTTASLGFAYLMSYGLYSDVHPINLLRVAGLALFAASGVWHRRMIEAV